MRAAPSPWPEVIDWFDITLDSPAENLALDEVLLQTVDTNPTRGILRTWLPDRHFVVVGRSNSIATEVNEPECLSQGVPIYRRYSGGGAVVVGPGCLGYALALPLTDELRTGGVVVVTRLVMETIAQQLADIVPGIAVCGTSDLAVHDRKFSGNSQRWLRHAFLHHGTILYGFELARIGQYLSPPSRQPEYRQQRSHDEFVVNLPEPRESIVDCLVKAWGARAASLDPELISQASQLAATRYESTEWIRDR